VIEPIFKISTSIGTLHENSLHAALKSWYKESEDKCETRVESYIIDIVRDDLLIEIQTKNFSAIKRKLEQLVKDYKILLVHPIVRDKWIINVDPISNVMISKRLSPKHDSYVDIFEELFRIPELISNPNFSIELPLVQIEEYRKNDGKGSRRRRGKSIFDQKLVNVLEKKAFYTPIDFLMLKPTSLKTPFTNKNLADSLNKPLSLAQKMSYCLRKMEMIKIVGKKGRSLLFDY
jgi:hypothetical protein